MKIDPVLKFQYKKSKFVCQINSIVSDYLNKSNSGKTEEMSEFYSNKADGLINICSKVCLGGAKMEYSKKLKEKSETIETIDKNNEGLNISKTVIPKGYKLTDNSKRKQTKV